MDGVTSSFPGYGDNLPAIEIGSGATATQSAGLAGSARVETLGIVFRKNGNCPDAKLGGGAHYADGNLAPICD
jgi:uncharacterized Ntn-hydrolase superfamily protein